MSECEFVLACVFCMFVCVCVLHVLDRMHDSELAVVRRGGAAAGSSVEGGDSVSPL